MTASYVTTPLAERADAILAAVALASGLSYMNDPIKEIAKALGSEVPDLEAFLPLWIARLQSDPPKGSSDWESERERWLRAAIGRRDGIAGLAHLARTSKRTEAARAWCDALVEKGDWSAALAAYEECAVLVEKDYLRGDFLDGAALAAQEIGSKDLTKKLEAAWLGAPSLLRVVRWLASGAPTTAGLQKRAAIALEASPTKAPRIVGFLSLLVGDVRAAAELLSKASGLGWSQAEHPGHLLFPAFAWLLGGAPAGSIRGELAASLHAPLRGDFDFSIEGDTTCPRLPSPTVIDVLQCAEVMLRLTPDDRKAMLDALKAAASRRTDGVLGEKRRRHYDHAAALVACCVELDDARGKASTSSWAEALRVRTSRFPAFQEELRRALAKAMRHAS